MGWLRDRLTANSRRERLVSGWAIGLSLFLLAVDQYTKFLVEKRFVKYESLPVVDGFFSLTYVTNKGAAWSMLEGHIWLLLLIALVVASGAIFFLRRLADGWAERYFAIFMVLSGVAGNSIDRIWRGAVVDFFDCYIIYGGKAWHWPVFNVADCAICVGVGIFFLSTLLRPANKAEAARLSEQP